MIAEILHLVAETKNIEQSFRFRPSSAGPERCVRQLVYQGLGYAKTAIPGRMLVVMDDSSWHEQLTADWINQTAYRLHSSQMRVEIDWAYGKLSGSIDGVITDLMGVDRLWEHKALNHFGFQRIENGKLPMDYLTQCCIYTKGLQKFNPAIDEFVLLIKNKNTAAYLEIIGRYSSVLDILEIKSFINSAGETLPLPQTEFTDILASALEKFVYAKGHIDNKTLPPRPYPFGTDFPCGYCGFEETCWAGYIEDARAAKEIVTIEAVKGEDEKSDTRLLYDQCVNYITRAEDLREGKKAQDADKAKIKGVIRSYEGAKGIEVVWPGLGRVVATITVRADDAEILTVRTVKEKK